MMTTGINMNVNWRNASRKVIDVVRKYKESHHSSDEDFASLLNVSRNNLCGLIYGEPFCTYMAAEYIESKLGMNLKSQKALIRRNPILINSSATSGFVYKDVDREGEMLYYRAMSDDIFENYLFKHTYVDRPDRGVCKALAVAEAKAHIDEGRCLTDEERVEIEFKDKLNKRTGLIEKVRNSKKGDFGYVFQKGDDFYIAINFQVRFR